MSLGIFEPSDNTDMFVVWLSMWKGGLIAEEPTITNVAEDEKPLALAAEVVIKSTLGNAAWQILFMLRDAAGAWGQKGSKSLSSAGCAFLI